MSRHHSAKETVAEDPLLTELEEIAKEVLPCFQCSACSGGCPVLRVAPDKQNPRSTAQELNLGKRLEIFESDNEGDYPSFWYCSLCYTCGLRCPQGVDLAHIFVKLKNLAVKHGYKVPEGLIEEAKTMATGSTSRITQSILKKREKLDLPQLPAPEFDELTAIMDVTGFSKNLERMLELHQSLKAKEEST